MISKCKIVVACVGAFLSLTGCNEEKQTAVEKKVVKPPVAQVQNTTQIVSDTEQKINKQQLLIEQQIANIQNQIQPEPNTTKKKILSYNEQIAQIKAKNEAKLKERAVERKKQEAERQAKIEAKKKKEEQRRQAEADRRLKKAQEAHAWNIKHKEELLATFRENRAKAVVREDLRAIKEYDFNIKLYEKEIAELKKKEPKPQLTIRKDLNGILKKKGGIFTVGGSD